MSIHPKSPLWVLAADEKTLARVYEYLSALGKITREPDGGFTCVITTNDGEIDVGGGKLSPRAGVGCQVVVWATNSPGTIERAQQIVAGISEQGAMFLGTSVQRTA